MEYYEIDNKQEFNPHKNIVPHKKKIAKLLICIMMLSMIFSHLHTHIEAQAAISSISSSTCPHNGNPGTKVGEVGCSYCGGTGGNWTEVAGHESQGDSLSAGTGYQQKKWNEDNEYIYYERYRCENCGDDGSYDCKPYTDKIGLFKVNKNTGVETQLQSGPYSAGPGYVPIRQCSTCAPILHGENITCYSVAAWAVPHVIKPEYTITVKANPAEGGTVSGGGKYKEDENITISATANEGWVFDGWEDGYTDASYAITVTEDKTYTAKFLKKITITTQVSPAGAGITSGDGIYIATKDTIQLSATANTGWKFSHWEKNGVKVSESFLAANDSGGTYTAVFTQNEYGISVSSNPSEGGTVSGSGTYKDGANVTLTATANKNWKFKNWTKDGNEVSTSATYTFKATEETEGALKVTNGNNEIANE